MVMLTPVSTMPRAIAIALALLSIAAMPAARAEVASEIESGSGEMRTPADSPSDAVAPMESSPDALPTAAPAEPTLPTDTPLEGVVPSEPPADAAAPNESATEAAAPAEPLTPMESAAEQLKEPREAGQFGVSRREDPFSILDDMNDASPPPRSAGRSKPEPGAVICVAGCDGPRGSVVSRGRTVH